MIGDGDPRSTNTLTVVSGVDVLDDAEIVTRDLLVTAALEPNAGFTSQATLDGALIELGNDSKKRTLNYTRNIAFNGDIQVLGAVSPELLVDETGTIITQRNISVTDNGAGTPIIVNDLANTNIGALAGKVRFFIPTSDYDSSSSSNVNASASLTGAPTITFLTGFERVSIVNDSDRELIINDIDVLSNASSFTSNVIIDVPPGANASFTNPTAATDPGRTAIEILNTGSNQVSLRGLINNPFGSTSVRNLAGNVVTVPAAVTKSAEVILEAESGQVGTAGNEIKIQSQSLTAMAGGDIFVDEILGDLNIVEVISASGNVVLTAAGSIFDESNDTDLDVQGALVTLNASAAGNIGASGNALEINATDPSAALTARAKGDIVIADIAEGLSIDVVESDTGNITLLLPDTPAFTEPGFLGEDLILLPDAVIRAIQGSIDLRVGDNIFADVSSVNAGIRAAGTVTITGDAASTDPDPGRGARIELRGTIVGTAPGTGQDAVTIGGGGDGDVIALRAVFAQAGVPLLQVGINAAGGPDIIRLGSNATGDPNVTNLGSGGVLDDIKGLVNIAGGDSSDTIELDDSGDTTANSGAITDRVVMGFGLASVVAYGGVGKLDISLGSGADTVSVQSTLSGTVTRVNTGDGLDTVNVYDWNNTVNQIAGLLVLDGDDGDDKLSVVDTGDAEDNRGLLDGNLLTGLGLGSTDQNVINSQRGISIEDFARVDISLGTGLDTFSVAGNTAVTTLDAGGGDDILSIGPGAVGDPANLAKVAADLIIRGGVGSNTLLVQSDVLSNITLKAGGVIEPAAAAGEISFEQIAALTITQSDIDGDQLTVENTSTDLLVNGRGGIDQITLKHVSHATAVNTGAGDDVVTVEDAIAPVTVAGVSNASSTSFDTLVVDRSAQTIAEVGGILTDGLVSGLTVGSISFSEIDGVEIRLGQENNALEINTTSPQTAVLVKGGPSDDRFTVRSIGGPTTTIDGQGEIDTVTAIINGQPIPNQFATLLPTVETLVVDNSNNDLAAVDWMAVDGTIIRASVAGFNGGAPFDVIPTSGADETHIIGGSDEALDHTLEVIANTPANIEGDIEGNKVTLQSGLIVLEPFDFNTFQNFEDVIDFDELEVQLGSSVNVYTEDSFTITAPGTLALNDLVSPALASSGSGEFELRRTASTDANPNNDEVFSIYSLSLANNATTPITNLTFTGTTLNGTEVTRIVPVVAAKANAGDPPVFTRIDFGDEFASLIDFKWTPGAAVIDNIVARPDNLGGGQATEPAIVLTYTISSDIAFNTSTGRLASGNIVVSDGIISATITPFTNLSGDGFAGLSYALLPGSIGEFSFRGDLIIENDSDGTIVSAVGTNPTNALSLRVANDVTIDPNVTFSVSADGQTGGVGGGGGGGDGGGRLRRFFRRRWRQWRRVRRRRKFGGSLRNGQRRRGGWRWRSRRDRQRRRKRRRRWWWLDRDWGRR